MVGPGVRAIVCYANVIASEEVSNVVRTSSYMTPDPRAAGARRTGVRLMKTSTVTHGSRIALSGRLDARGATQARAALHAAVLDGAGDLVVDMSGVEALDAVGLGVLVATRRLAFRHGRTLVLAGCTPAVVRLLQTTRLHRFLTMSQEPADSLNGHGAVA